MLAIIIPILIEFGLLFALFQKPKSQAAARLERKRRGEVKRADDASLYPASSLPSLPNLLGRSVSLSDLSGFTPEASSSVRSLNQSSHSLTDVSLTGRSNSGYQRNPGRGNYMQYMDLHMPSRNSSVSSIQKSYSSNIHQGNPVPPTSHKREADKERRYVESSHLSGKGAGVEYPAHPGNYVSSQYDITNRGQDGVPMRKRQRAPPVPGGNLKPVSNNNDCNLTESWSNLAQNGSGMSPASSVATLAFSELDDDDNRQLLNRAMSTWSLLSTGALVPALPFSTSKFVFPLANLILMSLCKWFDSTRKKKFSGKRL